MTLNSNDEDLFPDTELATTGMTGTVTDLQDEDTSGWYTADNADDGSDVSARFGMDNPAGSLTGTQNVYIYVRHTGNGGSSVSFTLELYEAGTLVSTVISDTTGSANTTGAEFSGTWDQGTENVVGDDVQYRFTATNTGGMPGARDVAELGYITWGAGTLNEVTVTTDDPTGVSTTGVTLNGTAVLSGFSSADVWFEWGETGAGFPNSTTPQTINSSQSFTDTITLSEDTEYEYRAHIESGDATDSDQGTAVSFWSLLSVGGNVVDETSTAIDGATVYISRVDPTGPTATLIGTETTDVNGDYSADVEAQGQSIHVSGEYNDGSTDHAGESKPYIS